MIGRQKKLRAKIQRILGVVPDDMLDITFARKIEDAIISIDPDDWCVDNDRNIKSRYTKCRISLIKGESIQAEFHLDKDLAGVVTRLTRISPHSGGRARGQRATSDEQPGGDAVPRFAEMLLYLFLLKSSREHLPGDLEEEYRTLILPKFGQRYARIWYWKQVVSSIWPVLRGHAVKLIGLISLTKLYEWLLGRVGL